MNEDRNALDYVALQPGADQEPHLARREAARPSLSKMLDSQDEAPCSCPGCFSIWD